MTAGMRASRVEWSHLVVSILSVERWLHRIRRNYFARSRASRTALNREQHAAEACARPFGAGGDRPETGQLAHRITLSDREALGERGPSRSARFRR